MNNFYTKGSSYKVTGKTSVVIEPDLLRQAKRKAMDRGITFQSALDEALRAWLSLPPPAMEEPDVRLRRALDGLRAAYSARPEIFDWAEGGMRAVGLLPPPARRKAERG